MTPQQHNNQPEDSQMEDLLTQAAEVDRKHSIDVSDTEQAFRDVARKSGIKSKSADRPYWAYAAAAAVLIGAFGLWYLFTPHRVQVPNGETQTVTLSDKTTITLNSGSKLIYPRWFNILDRTVELNGEAFFEVTQTGDPFIVEAGRAEITVMGTKFNIRSWKNEKSQKTSVFLKEGRVAFSSGDDHSVILDPGEYSWISRQQPVPVQPKATDSSKAMAWMNKALSFENQPLAVIFDEISRRFDVQIKAKSEKLLQETLTIYISNINGAAQTLDDICRAKGLQYTQTGDTFIISKSL